jgi:hypothetical protein
MFYDGPELSNNTFSQIPILVQNYYKSILKDNLQELGTFLKLKSPQILQANVNKYVHICWTEVLMEDN